MNINIFKQVSEIHQGAHQVEEILQKRSFNDEVKEKVADYLDQLFAGFQALKESVTKITDNTLTSLQPLEKQLIDLYGKLEDKVFDYEISLIAGEAVELTQALPEGDLSILATKVEKLKQRIFEYRATYRPGLDHLAICWIAEELNAYVADLMKELHDFAHDKQLKKYERLGALLRYYLEKGSLTLPPEMLEWVIEEACPEEGPVLYRKKEEHRHFLQFLAALGGNKACKNFPEKFLNHPR